MLYAMQWHSRQRAHVYPLETVICSPKAPYVERAGMFSPIKTPTLMQSVSLLGQRTNPTEKRLAATCQKGPAGCGCSTAFPCTNALSMSWVLRNEHLPLSLLQKLVRGLLSFQVECNEDSGGLRIARNPKLSCNGCGVPHGLPFNIEWNTRAVILFAHPVVADRIWSREHLLHKLNTCKRLKRNSSFCWSLHTCRATRALTTCHIRQILTAATATPIESRCFTINSSRRLSNTNLSRHYPR